MAYGQETHQPFINYNIVLDYLPANVRISMNVTMQNVDGSTTDEATRDSLFQSLLNKILSIPNTALVSASKAGTFMSTVTSP